VLKPLPPEILRPELGKTTTMVEGGLSAAAIELMQKVLFPASYEWFGTLTDAERQALFQAALDSQELFNALGDEQALKKLLDDPAARRRLLEALGEAREPLFERAAAWFTRPSAWALAGGAAAAVLLAVIAVRSLVEMPRKQAIALKTAQPAVSVPQATEAREAPKVAKDERRMPPAPATPVRKDVERIRQKETEVRAAAEFAAPPPAPPPPAEERAGVAGRQEQVIPMAAPAQPEELKSAVVADVATPAAERRGIRYSVLRQEPDGRYAAVDPRAVLQGGDRVRVAFEPDQDGNLYVLLGDPADQWRLVFRGRVEQRTQYSVPAEPIVLEGPAGERRLLAVFSPTPAPELEGAPSPAAAVRLRGQAAWSKRAETTGLKRAAAELRRESESDLLVEAVGKTAPGKPGEKAVYVVAPRPGAGSRVVVAIPLVWR